MVHLYGVIHGASDFDILGRRTDVFLSPSTGLQSSLARFLSGTKVGFEWLPKHQWKLIDNDYRHLVSEISNEFWSDDPHDDPLSIHGDERLRNVHDQYWSYLIGLSREEAEHIPVFLEDVGTWLGYNRALVESVKQDMKRNKLLVMKDGESELAYHRKLVGLNEAVHKAAVRARKIHEIDRDTKLLEAIAATGVEVAVVGSGHSAYWIANRDAIRQKWGITFDSYSAEVLDYGTRRAKFVKNPATPEVILERELFERVCNLVETGRLIPDKLPTYVGIWNSSMPSTGYFEVFVDSKLGDEISGTIEDPLGSAVFKGTVSTDQIVFTKRYTRADSDAVQGDIIYRGKKVGRDFLGRYHTDSFSYPFLISKPPATPENLSIRLGIQT